MAGLLSLFLFWLLCEFVLPHPHAPDGTVLAFWQMAIPLALGVGSALMANRKGKPPLGDAEFKAQSARDAARGGTAEDEYYNYMKSFDAGESARTTAGAMSADWTKAFGRDIEKLRGSRVSGGRLDTGYGDQDEDRYVTDFQDNIAKQLAMLSLDSTRMNLGARQDLGAYGERVTGRGLDLTATRRDQALADAASRRRMWGNLSGAFAGAAGRG